MTFARVRVALKSVALLCGVDRQLLKRLDIPGLNVVKFSLPRPVVQSTRADRAMDGAGWASVPEGQQIT